MDFPVEVTPDALAILRRLIGRSSSEGSFWRFGIKGGGCSGFEYVLRLDTKRLPIDIETEADGMVLVCDSKSAAFLQGAKLVASGNLIGGGLKFENPNAARSCGCGTSFTPRVDSRPS